MQYVLGVDEAGRAPLAGPVAVGIVAVAEGLDVAREFPGVKDSKQLTELARERLFAALEARVALGDARFRVCYGTHTEIDARGITIAVKRAIRRGVLALAPLKPAAKHAPAKRSDLLEFEGQTFNDYFVYLDGALYAPREYAQETIVGGDVLVPLISLASIAAKVSRDHLMGRLAKKYPAYGFEKHKGYPTKAHYAALARDGPCEIHRRSYLHSWRSGDR